MHWGTFDLALHAWDEPAEIWCRGRVVRAVSQVGGQIVTEYAVAIDQYDFVPSSPRSFTD